MGFSDFQLDDLRSRADLVSLINRRVPLRKTGKDFVGLCPFHGEKTPSFYVVPAKQLWHCFGCGLTGDVFGFFMRLDGTPFIETVQLVAREAGVTLVDEKLDPEEARRRAHLDDLTELLERAIKFYESKLWHAGGRAALDHLLARGVKEAFVKQFRLGFGGATWDGLARALEKAGASPALAAEAGLLIGGPQPDGSFRSWFDRFNGRLIVPIRVPRPPNGRPVGLGGRFLEAVTPVRGDRKPAKYVNSPETPLYQKSGVLFGLAEARDTIRRTEKALVVEGYFDVIGVHQAGLPLAVATCGTSLTPSHVELLVRTGAKELVFLFDGDTAGVRAAARAAELCAREQVPSRVASLPDGQDPDEFARQRGPEGLQALMERARPAVEYLIDKAMAGLGPSPTVEARVRVVHEIKPLVLSAPDGLSRELYVAQVADRLGVSPGVVQSALYAPVEAGVDDRPATVVAAGGKSSAGRAASSHAASPRFSAPAAQAPEAAFPGEGAPLAPSLGRPPPPVDLPRTELGIVVALARFPAALGPLVHQESLLPRFVQPELRQFGEGLLSPAVPGAAPDLPGLLAAVADVRVRSVLQRRLAEDDATLEQTAAHLALLLDKWRLESRQRAARDALRRAGGSSSDPESQRAFEQQQQEQLAESQAAHRRMRERLRRS